MTHVIGLRCEWSVSAKMGYTAKLHQVEIGDVKPRRSFAEIAAMLLFLKSGTTPGLETSQSSSKFRQNVEAKPYILRESKNHITLHLAHGVQAHKNQMGVQAATSLLHNHTIS